MKRAAVSEPSNIAEGAARGSAKSFHNYLVQADGSLAGLDTQFELAWRLSFATEEEISDTDALRDETSTLVGGLQRSQRVSE
jgi:four helix bundle protein